MLPPPKNTHMRPQFHEMKEESDGCSPLLTVEQQQWMSVQMLISTTAVEVRMSPDLALVLAPPALCSGASVHHNPAGAGAEVDVSTRFFCVTAT